MSKVGLEWTTPSKKINAQSDLVYFKKSVGYRKLFKTLTLVILKVTNVQLPGEILDPEITTRKKPVSKRSLPSPSAIVESEPKNKLQKNHQVRSFNGILEILSQLNKLIDDTPPLAGPRRFGNMACRDWHDKVIARINNLFDEYLELPQKTDKEGLYSELGSYLLNSFGSKIRLDYGTGHELSFLAFLGGLFELKILPVDLLSGVDILTIFAKYYDLVRRLIIDYNLEPAGSHGVWGLDDHFHLIYILGAAQFNGDKLAPPVLQVLTSQVISTYKSTNLYVNAIAFIYKIKLGPFNEHSPIIYDIHASVVLWSKVLQGLFRMYEVEVFGKFPVVQHFYFGNVLYTWRDSETNRELPITSGDELLEEDDSPGFLNGYQGVNTTRSNISMTGAPWANKPARAIPPTHGHIGRK